MLTEAGSRLRGSEQLGLAFVDLGRCRPGADVVRQLVRLWSDPPALPDASDPAGPDRLWVLELVSKSTPTGIVDVAVVIDAFSRRVLGWEVSRSTGQVPAMHPDLVSGALRRALRLRRRCRRNAGQPRAIGQNRRVAVGVGCSGDAGSTVDSLKIDGRRDVGGQVARWALRHNWSRIHESRVGYLSPVSLERRNHGRGPRRVPASSGGSVVAPATRLVKSRRPVVARSGRVSWVVALRVLLCGSAAAGLLFVLVGGWNLWMVLPTVVFGLAWWVDDWAAHRTGGGRR